VLDLSVRALPRAYNVTAAPAGTAVVVQVKGEAGDTWSVIREVKDWTVLRGRADAPRASVSMDEDAAWRLLFNVPGPARERATVEGDPQLAEPVFAARAVMV
jgi:hypothetical protein